jgi:hypothetical protein
MLSHDRLTTDVRHLLELRYLESASDNSKNEYARLSEIEKRMVLKTFLQNLTVGADADEWAIRLGDTL